jgi:hypothetical protein
MVCTGQRHNLEREEGIKNGFIHFRTPIQIYQEDIIRKIKNGTRLFLHDSAMNRSDPAAVFLIILSLEEKS